MKLITLFFQAIGGKLIGRLVNGIAVREIPKDKETQQCIQLGHYGKDQWCAKVGMLRKDPPVVRNGKVYDAVIVSLPNTKKQNPEDPSIFYVLGAVKADDNDTRILVRVNTEGTYKNGSIGSYPKDADELPHGWGKHTGPDGGGESFWHDGLVTMAPGDILPIQPEGGVPEDVIGLYYDTKKGLGIVSVSEYQRLAALATAKPVVVSAPPVEFSDPCPEPIEHLGSPKTDRELADKAKPAPKKAKPAPKKAKTAAQTAE